MSVIRICPTVAPWWGAVLLAQCASEAALMSFYGDSTSGRLLYGDAVDAAAFAGLPLAVRFTDPLPAPCQQPAARETDGPAAAAGGRGGRHPASSTRPHTRAARALRRRRGLPRRPAAVRPAARRGAPAASAGRVLALCAGGRGGEDGLLHAKRVRGRAERVYRRDAGAAQEGLGQASTPPPPAAIGPCACPPRLSDC